MYQKDFTWFIMICWGNRRHWKWATFVLLCLLVLSGLAGDGSLGHPHSSLILSLHPHLTLQSLHVSTPPPLLWLLSDIFCLGQLLPPLYTPLFSASALSVINLLSSHLTVYEWFMSHQFTTAQTRTDNTAMMERFSIIFYHQLVLHSEVANYLDAKLNLVPALWLLLLLLS